MAKPKKKAGQMTDKELVRALFPKAVRKQLKAVLLELNREQSARRKSKKR
jgi:hypothetical protein